MAIIGSLFDTLASIVIAGAATQGIIWGIMAIGVYITYKILDIADLTVDGSFTTGAAVLVVCVTQLNIPVLPALFLSFVVGCLAGLATGIFHTKFGIPAILAGILTQFSLYSINLRIMQKANLPLNVRKYSVLLSSFNVNAAFVTSLIFAAIVIAILYLFFGTELGMSLRSTGCNPHMSRANGINTERNKVLGLMISNGIVAVSGGLIAQYQGFADINMGRGAIVIGLAAVIIGEVLFSKIYKNFAMRLASAVVGGILYYIIITLVLKMGLRADDLKLLSALVVAVFLAVPYWKTKLAQIRPSKEEKPNA
jgi:putative ABC transport system permease protein